LIRPTENAPRLPPAWAQIDRIVFDLVGYAKGMIDEH